MDNIKVDIIYYNIGTDFEMEFNLCGCCRMRLLTDKVQNRNEFTQSLSRAVSRSRIIMACGPLFGETGLINTVGVVTGIGTELLDNKSYGVETDDEIPILKGSTPLVTSDGIFGGCIIENGPQTIILLSESKTLRKQIMKDLIHPYILQTSHIAVLNTISEETGEAVEEVPEIVAQPAEFLNEEELLEEEEKEYESLSEIDSEYIIQNEVQEDEDEITFLEEDLQEEEKVTFVGMDSANAVLPNPVKNYSYYGSGNENNENNNHKKLDISISVIIALSIVILALIAYITIGKPIISGKNVFEYIQNALTPKAVAFAKFLL